MWGPPLWTEYPLAHVRVTAAEPPGGPLGAPLEVLLRGNGFMSLGEGQLVCIVGGTLVAATLIDPTRLVRESIPSILT